MTKRKIVLISLVLILFIPFLASVYVKGDINTLISYKTNSSPTIDGTFTESEWSDAYHTSFFHEPTENHPDDYVHVYIKNTQNKLYILFDDLPDNTSDNDDYVNIYFDCNYDNIIDNNISMNLRRDHAPDSMIGNQLAHWIMGFGPSPNEARNHTIMEFSINITFSSAYDGKSTPNEMGDVLPVGNTNTTIRIFFMVSVSFCGWQIPQTADGGDPTSYADLTLNRVPSNVPFGNPLLIASIMMIALLAISLRISKKTKSYC
ncbi:MAG: hypothetical protein R6W84_12455 [Promethearchaeia archaeon]